MPQASWPVSRQAPQGKLSPHPVLSSKATALGVESVLQSKSVPVNADTTGQKRDTVEVAQDAVAHRRIKDKEYQLGRRSKIRVAQDELKSVIPGRYFDAIQDIDVIKILRGGESLDTLVYFFCSY